MNLDAFTKFRKHTIGYHQSFQTPYGTRQLIYADWTASGRLYRPIETRITENFGPYMGNTHSYTSVTGRVMTEAYHYAAKYIKSCVGAGEDDVLLACGTGATSAIHKLQRILGLCLHEKLKPYTNVPDSLKPVIFITHMEHHSNHTSWLETIGDVVLLPPGQNGEVSCNVLESALLEYAERPIKIGSFTACSNVTGVKTPYHALAKVMHQHGGVIFIDFSASAPYVPIHMHGSHYDERLDAIFLSPHKFLGGPGSCGLLIFNSALYSNATPDRPGGGTVTWTNPWGGKAYVDDIEVREDGGTPGILQLIRAGLAFQLKEKLLAAHMADREETLVRQTLSRLNGISNLQLLDGHLKNRLAIFSFCFPHLHYNLVVQLLNDRYGIQSRGGCSCAGTYGHYLLHINKQQSKVITELIDQHDLSHKPGWVRISLHPIMTDEECSLILHALEEISKHGTKWARDYVYDARTNEFTHKDKRPTNVASLFRRASVPEGF